MNIPKHSIRFGKSSETRILEKHQDSFDAITFNASTLAHFGRSLSSFVFIKAKGKSFFIDPQTHAFQHPLNNIKNKNNDLKVSIKNLIDFYGEPLKQIIIGEGRSIVPQDFKGDMILGFVNKVLDFQRNHLFVSLEQDFKEYFEEEEFRDLIPSAPIFLVAPYFYMNHSNYENWLKLNMDLVGATLEKADKNDTVFAEMVIDIPLLLKMSKDNSLTERILNTYELARGILLWVDEFNEHTVFEDTLKAMVTLIKRIKEKYPGKKVINLYGGYFSQLLMKKGLDGVVHGPEYGESRSVVPVGGGIPIAKYYYPSTRKRIPSNDMLYTMNVLGIQYPQKFYKDICGCKICRQKIRDKAIEDFQEVYGKVDYVEIRGRGRSKITRAYPITETIENCLSHYLEVKKEEFAHIDQNSLESLLKELEDTYNQFNNNAVIGMDNKEFDHLLRWKNALNDV